MIMFIELLAESDGIPAQGYLFIIVMVFSFLKWLYDNLLKKIPKGDDQAEELESLYELYREEIQQRQSLVTPPPLKHTPKQATAVPPALPASPKKSVAKSASSSTAYSHDDIERVRLLKESAALAAAPKMTSLERQTKPRSTGTLKQQLRNKNSLRNALVLNEILSKPKALRDSEL